MSQLVMRVAVPPLAGIVQSAPMAVKAMRLPSGDGAAAMFVPSWNSTDTSLVEPCRVFTLTTGTAGGVTPERSTYGIRPPPSPPHPATNSDAAATATSVALRVLVSGFGRGFDGSTGRYETDGRASAAACLRMFMSLSPVGLFSIRNFACERAARDITVATCQGTLCVLSDSSLTCYG